jgi:5-hydroxyisourate hydrolase/2-oxo-4-hydroxy-4-carboxy-5-ureidoimidazoline decarboxylase
MLLKDFNRLTKSGAFQVLEKCCVSKSWINHMIENMPFESADSLLDKAANNWYNQCQESDWKEAFEGHPKIGDIESLKQKFSNTQTWANKEQASVAEASQSTLEDLAKANDEYVAKFGYIFIVSATGKSADEMLRIIKARLLNHPKDEIRIAMGEQHKITVIRLLKIIEGFEGADLRSYVTTHVLDTTTGIPAKNVQITLKELVEDTWQTISMGITNLDGRISNLLPPAKNLKAGKYLMVFNTEDYYQSQGQTGFYPEVGIQFLVSNHEHYHVPLLLNPYGYTTYRGS